VSSPKANALSQESQMNVRIVGARRAYHMILRGVEGRGSSIGLGSGGAFGSRRVSGGSTGSRGGPSGRVGVLMTDIAGVLEERQGATCSARCVPHRARPRLFGPRQVGEARNQSRRLGAAARGHDSQRSR
jgi:hypothetical protein